MNVAFRRSPYCNIDQGPMNKSVDERYEQLTAWAEQALGRSLVWETVSADASKRRYFRAYAGHDSWIAVDAPPSHENNSAFIRVAGLMQQAGLHVPRILAHDLEQGFMCLTDLGRQTYLDVLDEFNADELFTQAMQTLLDWQRASRPGVLPDYDRATLAREMMLFKSWYIPCHLNHALSQRDSAAIDRVLEFMLDQLDQQAVVFVHRDYMPRNLMMCAPVPGIIDFQDARYGPVGYDIASLFKDAFISWPEERVTAWQAQYWQQALAEGIPVASDWSQFQTDVALAGAQRHLKVLGLFERLARQQGKARYVADLGRFKAYLQPVIEQFPELSPLQPFIADGMS